MDKFNYYQDQLNRLKDVEYFKSVKVFDGNGEHTKQMDLNIESIPTLIEFLTKELTRLQSLDTKD